MKVALARPWLTADLGRPMRVLSWSLNRPGFVEARRIVWREVRNADLPPDLDAAAWFEAELAAAGEAASVGFLTSRDVTRHAFAAAEVEGVRAEVLATVGLSNAECVGTRRAAPAPVGTNKVGTINIAAALSGDLGGGLSDAGLLEAMSIVVQARTAAVMTHGPRLGHGPATGTGTDCVAVAAPPGAARHAGLHTAIGHALGAATLDAVSRGARDWMHEQGERPCRS